MGRRQVAARAHLTPDGSLAYGSFLRGEVRLSFAEVIRGLAEDQVFRGIFLELLASSPFAAYRWETPPLLSSSLERDFECVFLDSPYLDIPSSPRDFAEHFPGAGGAQAVSFLNLGGDGIMIAPCPTGTGTGGPQDSFAHLGAFCATAPAEHQHALWQLVGETLRNRIGDSPVWWSTAGGGVPWLHVRLDDRPKYYGHAPYRRDP